jgi:hypothetical protein
LPRLPPRRAELKPAARVNGTCYDRRGGRNPAGRNAGGVPSAYHFDVLLGERDPLLGAEELQQDFDALARAHVGEDRQVTGEGAAQDPNPSASPERRWWGQIDQPTDLAPADFIDDRVRHLGRPHPSMIRLMTPAVHRAACHCASTTRKQ